MAKVNAAEFAEKWQRRTKAATPDVKRGIERVTTAPGEQAAAQQATMLANLTAAITSGRWANAVAGVSLADWKASALSKGLQRIAAGVDGATPNLQRIAVQLLTDTDAAVAAANQTPRGDLEANIGRMNTYVRARAERKLVR